jgi:voltage-gated potassium channel
MIDRKYVYSVIEVRDTNNPKINTAYDGLMILMIVISLIPLMYREQTPLLLWFDRITVVFFIIDYILRWATADIQFPDKRKWVAFLIYPFSWMAVIDLLSILPSVGVFARAFKALRIVRLLKLLRLFRFLRYSHRVTTLLVVLKKENKVLLAVLGLYMFYVLATALFMYNVEMGSVGPDGEPVFDNFFDALYWASITLTTVGYGDIYPVSEAGRVVAMISALFGVAVIALPSGVITASYLDELRKKNEAEEAEKE